MIDIFKIQFKLTKKDSFETPLLPAAILKHNVVSSCAVATVGAR